MGACLKWIDFESSVSGSFAELREQDDFCDVTLASDAGNDDVGSLRAHKVILSACSPLFRKLLRQHPETPSMVLYLRGISTKVLGQILDFMYHGEVSMEDDEVSAFLDIGKSLRIKGMSGQSGEAETKSQPPPKRSNTSTYGETPKRARVAAAPKKEELAHDEEEPGLEHVPQVKSEMGQAEIGDEGLDEDAAAEGEEGYNDAYYEEEGGYDESGAAVAGTSAAVGGDKDLYSLCDLKNLLANKVQKGLTGFVCLICGKVIKRRGDIRRHLKLMHIKSEESYRCPPCDKTVSSRTAMYNHVYKYHPDWKVTTYEKFKVPKV